MAQRPKEHPPVDAATLDTWRRRKASLRDKLDTHAEHEWAWLWEIRIQLIDYLLSRYDAEGMPLDAEVFQDDEDPSAQDADSPPREPVAPYLIDPPATPPSVPPEFPGRPATEDSARRRRLHSLAQANHQRHADNALERERLIAEAEGLLKQGGMSYERARAIRKEIKSCRSPAQPRVLIDDRDGTSIAAMLEMANHTQLAKLIIDDMDDEAFYEFMTGEDLD